MTVASAILNCGGRKFVLVATSYVSQTALFAAGILSESGFITLTMAILGAYLTANGIQKFNEIKKAP